MNRLRKTRLYEGKGEKLQDRGYEMPRFEVNKNLFAPEHYRPDENLLDAVNVAITLGMPLLVTGEPGTGKTQLAYSVAWELGLGEPDVFYTKSTSVYTDLFYQYDALRHFRDSRGEAAVETEKYIEYGPLGRAILRAMDRKDPNCPKEFREQPQRRTVVLVDELDKAPRDLPNDILNEVERMMFQVKELPPEKNTFKAGAEFRPILILTSNLEKDLPEAFRRRCVFFHIEFKDLDLQEIVRRRLPGAADYSDETLGRAIAHFRSLRELQGLDKLPGPAELIAWVDLLARMKFNVKSVKELDDQDRAALAASYSILAKSDEDLRKMRETVLLKGPTG